MNIFKIYWGRFRLNFGLSPRFKSHLSNLNSSSIVFDVGANRGEISRIFAKTSATVFSIEPNYVAYELLVVASKTFPNIKPFNCAAGISNREVNLFLHRDTKILSTDLTQASSLLGEKSNVSNKDFQKINEIDFVEFIHTHAKSFIDIIKIDIEGYEVTLLNDMLDRLDFDKVGIVFVETHEKQVPSLLESTNELKLRIHKLGLSHKFDFTWH